MRIRSIEDSLNDGRCAAHGARGACRAGACHVIAPAGRINAANGGITARAARIMWQPQ